MSNRKTGGKTNTDGKTEEKQAVRTGTEAKILDLVSEKPTITIPELAEKIGLSDSGVRYAIAQLRKKNLLEREGSRKQGKWIVR